MSFRFKSEDFSNIRGWVPDGIASDICDVANQLLDAHVETLPEVFTHRSGALLPEYCTWSHGSEIAETHHARLWNVEPVHKKPCPHEPDQNATHISWYPDPKFEAECKHCGEPLVARWR